MASELKRITVLVTEKNFAIIKELAGDVPLSKWIQKQILNSKQVGDKLLRRALDQPGNEKANVADRPSEDAARTPRIRVARRGTGATRGLAKHGVHRNDGSNDTRRVSESILSSANESVPATVGNATPIDESQYTPHTAESNWLTHMCASCVARRKRANLAIGEIPTKREKKYGKK
jgi:hypothetical protein